MLDRTEASGCSRFLFRCSILVSILMLIVIVPACEERGVVVLGLGLFFLGLIKTLVGEKPLRHCLFLCDELIIIINYCPSYLID